MDSFREIATTTAIIFLLWSIRTYRCTEGFKPGEWRGSLFHYSVTFNGFFTLSLRFGQISLSSTVCRAHTQARHSYVMSHIFRTLIL